MKFTDIMHKEIWIDDEYLEIIQTSAFQRLLGIKQQGNTYFLLPGTTHNRYSHSIGVFENMRKIVNHLMNNKNMILSTYEVKLAFMSALLHDIGHGPFSHCFEHISGIHHEIWTRRIIEEYDDINRILSRTHNLLSDVQSVINRNGKYELIEKLLFSPVGADSLDYHNRDLVYSGIILDSYDLSAVISNMNVYENKLLFNLNAIREIEKFIRIKRDLFEKGFNHPIVIGKDVLMQLLFKRAEYLFKLNKLEGLPMFLLPLFNRSDTWAVDKYILLDDEVIHNLIQQWSLNDDHILSVIARKYVEVDAESIYWVEVDDNHSYEGSLQEYLYAFFSQDKKYACYSSGIYINDSGSIVDVLERSEMIRKFSDYDVKHFLFSISEFQ